MRIIYVAGPFSASCHDRVETNRQAARYTGCLLAAIPGVFPLIPHQLGQGLEAIGDYEYWIAATLEVMRRCDAVFAMPRHAESKGATAEIAEAIRLGIPVFYATADVQSWVRQ